MTDDDEKPRQVTCEGCGEVVRADEDGAPVAHLALGDVQLGPCPYGN